MKRYASLSMLAAGCVLSGLFASPAFAFNPQPEPPGSPAALDVFFTDPFEMQHNVLMTGPVLVRAYGRPVMGGPLTIQTEMLSMSLTGFDPMLGMVTLHAGSSNGFPASVGQLTLNGNNVSNAFPAQSFFDVFFDITYQQINTSGPPTTVIFTNQQPLRIQTTIGNFPPICFTYTNTTTNPTYLIDTTGQYTAIVSNCWVHSGKSGRETKCAVSLDVTNGFMTPGVAKMTICTNATGAAINNSVIYNIIRQQLTGQVFPNGCNDCLYPCSSPFDFVATWISDLRAPDWRGFHKGTWKMFCQGTTNLLARGTMEGSNGAGTHRNPLSANCENCSECAHFEGLLKGGVFNPFSTTPTAKTGTIEATYAGDFLDAAGNPLPCTPPLPRPPSGPFRMTIEGVEVLHCQ